VDAAITPEWGIHEAGAPSQGIISAEYITSLRGKAYITSLEETSPKMKRILGFY